MAHLAITAVTGLLTLLSLDPWPTSRPVEGKLPAQDELAAIEVDGLLLQETKQGLKDVRLVDEVGQEVPYALVILSPGPYKSVPMKMISHQTTKTGSEWLFFFKDHKNYANAGYGLGTIRFKTTDVPRQLKFWGSHDNKTWELMEEKTVYPVNGEQIWDLRNTTQGPYVKLTETAEKKPEKPMEVVEVTLSIQKIYPSDEMVFDLRLIDHKKESSLQEVEWWEIDLGENYGIMKGLMLEAPHTDFNYRFMLHISHDGKEWRFHSEVHHDAHTSPETLEEMRFPVANVARYARLTIHYSAGIAFPEGIWKGFSWRTLLVFKNKSSGSYSLYYGNPGANKPIYDTQLILGAFDQYELLPRLTLGPSNPNPNYKKPWVTPQVIFPAVLVLASLCLGALVLSLLRKTPTA